MKRSLPFAVLFLAGCNSPAIVRTGLTAKPSPIEVKGFKIDAKLTPFTSGPSTRFARVTATAPPHWSGPFELTLSSEEDPVGGSGTSTIGARRAELESSVSTAFGKGDNRIFGRVTPIATADETVVLPTAVVTQNARGHYFLKLDKPHTVITPSGFILTFPKQGYQKGDRVNGSPTEPALRVICSMPRRGRVAALKGHIPPDADPEKVSAALYDDKGSVRFTSVSVTPGDHPIDHVLQFEYFARKVGAVGPLKFKVRHRADLEVIPFSIVAVP
jgi:hypothetical protein